MRLLAEEISEFLPIKLTPGFIAVAFHLGCIGCNFCSVRYGTSRDAIFRAGIHATYPWSPSEIIEHLHSMPSFVRARVPIRLGNDTDIRFEIEEVIDFVRVLPGTYPIALLTRFPISRKEADSLGRANVVLKLTATPMSRFLSSPDNAIDVVASIQHIQTPVVVTIGPVTRDNYRSAVALVDRVPRKKNVAVYIKPLNVEFDPSLNHIPHISEDEYRELRRAVANAGFRHLSQLTCLAGHALRLPYKRVADVPDDERQYCGMCSARDGCYAPAEPEVDAFAREVAGLGFRALRPPVKSGFRSYFIDVDLPAGFGDEAYLSEIFHSKVKLSTTVTGTVGGRYAASREVLDRWERVGFFSTEKLIGRMMPILKEKGHA